MNKNEQRMHDKFKKDGYEVFRAGWPDLLVMKDGVVRLIELKTPLDKLSAVQIRLHDALKRGLGLQVEVIRIETVDKLHWDKMLAKRIINNYLHK